MNLNTIIEVKRPASADEITQWRDGYAWLGGGTWLFSEPQWATDTLIDLDQLALAGPAGLAGRARDRGDLPDRRALSFRRAGGMDALRRCFASAATRFLASFKIWNAATVGGNICMSLPAGPMISLTAALEATYTLWPRGCGAARGQGDRLRHREPRQRAAGPASCCAASTCRPRRCAKRFAFRRASLTHLGRSAALMIGTQDRARR